MRLRSEVLCVLSFVVLGACRSPGDRSDTSGSASGQESSKLATGSSAPDTRTAQASGGGLSSGDTTAVLHWSFDDLAVGDLPAGWKLEKTHPRERAAKWSVQRDPSAPSGDHVLALTDPGDSRGTTFNLAWTDGVSFLDGTLQVKVRTGTGREDRGGGPMWRVRDANNYYVARWNPLEDNLRLYYVKDGERVQLETARVSASPKEWHTITVRQKGDHIEILLDGEKLLETTDDTFREAGGVGVWTKADAASFFDDFQVEGDAPETR